ncbi:group I truncated hemoglobin [Granulosicoccus sp. 3-233]|uniref:group I truncated hemoglobin n=1 Tax=Granulosicoccus sp. 3-233 TaxID=3417969 RepID=UPI003D343D67
MSLYLTACTITPDNPSPKTLYEELGGEPGVEQLTTDFIREIAADERIKGRYRNSDIGRFHRMMVEQMCMKTGGGCAYTGDDMQQTHAGMKITRVEFNAIVEALMRAMDRNALPQGVQNRLLALYAPMHGDIVNR